MWSVIDLHEGLTPSIEIKSAEDLTNIFPINVLFKLDYSILDANIEEIKSADNKNTLLYKLNRSCASKDQDFKIVSD